jgi:uncharacterized membrane protein
MQVPSKYSNNIYRWMRDYFILLIIILLTIYLLFAFLAPVFMKGNFQSTGKILYLFYSKFCHQYAHRSWFLFGEQAYYPAYVPTDSELKSINDVFQISIEEIDESRKIIGNENAGYKVAICQRDLAIYSSLLLFAFAYIILRKKIRKISIYSWFIFGVIPLGVDGIWQLISTMNILNMNLQVYESTPLIRTITGGLFGLFTGWYLYPAIEDAFREDRSVRK